MPKILATAIAVALALSSSQAQTAPLLPFIPRGVQNCAAVTPQTCITAAALGRGINMGNMLDAPREGDWGVKLEPAYIDMAAANFHTVRLPIRWSNHAAPTADATLDPVFAARVDQAIDSLLAKGLYVVINVHHYSQLFGDPVQGNEFSVDPAVLEIRLINIWKQLALRYKNRSPKLMFELLNEPHGKYTSDAWNALIPKLFDAVRPSNPNRIVVVSPIMGWVSALGTLKLPADRNVIVDIHNYDPVTFSFQGISWMPQFPLGPTCCDAGQKKVITDNLDKIKSWNATTGYPVRIGEFGAHSNAPIDSRENYTRFFRDEAEKRGFAWTYWEFASSFGVYSPKLGSWVEPVRRALLD